MEEYSKNSNDLLHAIKKTVSRLDGVYAVVIKDETGSIALVRDIMGVRQIYYGENNNLVAFASERKALWKVGLKEPTQRVMPGQAVVILPNGEIQKYIVATSPVRPTKVVYKTLSLAIREYQHALIASAMKKRTQDFSRVGIIFSGGIDSVIIAWLAKKMVPEVICYTGGVSGSNDIAFARFVAKRLDLKLRVNELSPEEVEQMLPEVIDTIENNNAGQVEVAIPVYGAVKLAHEDGINVMFSGQGADGAFWRLSMVCKCC